LTTILNFVLITFLDTSGGDDQQACSAAAATADNLNCDDSGSSLTRSSLSVDMGGGDRKERACDSLIMCIVTTLNQGLRNGGGIGDILRAPSSEVYRIIDCNLILSICIEYFNINRC